MKSKKYQKSSLLFNPLYLFSMGLIICLLPAVLFSQNIITTVQSDTTCPAEVVIPISVTNFDSVEAISLALIYETSVLTYNSYQNLHDSLTGGFTIVNASGGKVIISWVSMAPATVDDNDTLLELRFTSNGGFSNLVWDTITPGNCEYSDYNGTIVPSNYVNGTALVYFVPEIVSQPVSSSIIEGENTAFAVSATGESLAYQWQESTNGGTSWNDLSNSATYSGVTSNTLDITAATLGMDGFLYHCIVSGTCAPDVASDDVLLTVNPTPQLITTSAPTMTICAGSIAVPITVNDCNGVGAISLILAYDNTVLNYSGYQNLHTELSSGSTIVNANNGKVYFNWASLTAANVGDDILFELLFSASEGASDLIWQDMFSGSCEYSDINGDVINSNYVDGTITVQAAPAITQHPVDASIIIGENVDFSITATGAGLSYQWQESINGGISWNSLSDTSPYSGVSTATLNITGATLTMDMYLYRCVVSGTCPPSIVSNQALLNVNPIPQLITTTAPIITICPGNVAIPITVDDCDGVGAISLTLEYDTAILGYTGYQNPNPELSSGVLIVNPSGNKVIISWASLTAANIGDATLLELNFSGVTGYSVFDWSNGIDGSCEYSDINGVLINSAYVDGNITINEPPSISSHPSDSEIIENEDTDFTISASGTGIAYQWQESTNGGGNWNSISNNSTFSGATTNTLHITGATIGMDGNQYRCVVSGTCPPSVVSNTALLTVQPTPQLITTTIGSVSSMDASVTVPITVTDCNGVAAISLVLNYDPYVLEYEGYTNPHSDLTNGFLIVNGTFGHCIISWASFSTANVGNGTLMELNFKTHVGSTALTWDTNTSGNCEYSDANGNVILSEYYNGNAIIGGILIDVKAFLEGSFNTTEMGTALNPDWLPLSQPYATTPWNYSGSEHVSSIPNADVVDWVLMELRETSGDASTATASTVIARQAGFILKDGSLVRVNGVSPLDFRLNISQNLFVVIRHRNHLGIMSANPLTETGGIYSYDFTASNTQAYGGTDAQTEITPGVWGMFGGNGDGNGDINMNDKTNVWSTQAGTDGYIPGDFNMDGKVQNQDKNDVWVANIEKVSQVP